MCIIIYYLIKFDNILFNSYSNFVIFVIFVIFGIFIIFLIFITKCCSTALLESNQVSLIADNTLIKSTINQLLVLLRDGATLAAIDDASLNDLSFNL